MSYTVNITVTDSLSNAFIPNAYVEIDDAYFGTYVTSGKTDQNGFVSLSFNDQSVNIAIAANNYITASIPWLYIPGVTPNPNSISVVLTSTQPLVIAKSVLEADAAAILAQIEQIQPPPSQAHFVL